MMCEFAYNNVSTINITETHQNNGGSIEGTKANE